VAAAVTVEIEGVGRFGFSQVSGLTTDDNIIEYREGNEVADAESTTLKQRGLIKYGNIVCKQGLTNDLTAYNWRLKVIQSQTPPASGSITLLDETQHPTLRWRFRGVVARLLEDCGPPPSLGDDFTLLRD
jgi:phage tail-like protein